jgi:hypothetical protein
LPANTREARQQLIDVTRREAAAVTAGQSAEALFGYLTRLDNFRDGGLPREALAERAAEAELHSRVVLSAGLEALNELHDLGLLDDAPTPTTIEAFNQTKLSDAVREMAEVLGERMPAERWDWLETASQLVEDVELRVQKRDGCLWATVSHSGHSTVVHLNPKDPGTRVSQDAFFSAGLDRVYVPTSAIFSSTADQQAPVAGYDAVVGGMAFAREWIYRHARNAAELGPPARSGGGPALVVVVYVLVIAAAVVAVAGAVVEVVCLAGSDKACRLAAYLGLAGTVLGGSAKAVDANSGQQRVLSYNTNVQ